MFSLLLKELTFIFYLKGELKNELNNKFDELEYELKDELDKLNCKFGELDKLKGRAG